jgi:signal transduction histidine kinase
MRSLWLRLFSAAAVFVSLALILVWFTLARLFENQVMEQYERELVSVIDTLAANLDGNDGGLKLAAEPADPRFSVPAGGRYWQIWLKGAPLLRSRSLWDTEIKYSGQEEGYGQLTAISGPSGEPILALSQKLNIEGSAGAFDVIVTAAADKSDLDAALDSFNKSLIIMLSLTAFLLLGALGLQVFFGLRPLENLRDAVARIRTGDANSIDETGPYEVRPLVSEINTLLVGERAAVERAKARASDLAHGLKTPLTILGQIGESLTGIEHAEAADKILEQVDLIRSRIDRQLALSRIAATGKERVEAKGVVDKLLTAMRQIQSPNSLSWHSTIPTDIALAVDAGDFAEACGNVLDNARMHAKSKIMITAKELDRRMRMTVEDDGKGISEADYGRVLAPGQRLDDNNQGSGLGLAITADILRAYGGTLSLGRAEIGGLLVTMDWPMAQMRKIGGRREDDR